MLPPIGISTFTPVRLNVLIHIIKIVINLLHKVRGTNSSEDKLVSVVPVLVVPDVAKVGTLLLFLLGILEPAALVPNLQSATRHYSKTLNIILQPWSIAAAEWVETGHRPAQLALLTLLDNVEGLAGLAAVLIEHDSTCSGHRGVILDCIEPLVTTLNEADGIERRNDAEDEYQGVHGEAVNSLKYGG